MKAILLTLAASLAFSVQAYSLEFTNYETPYEVLAKAFDEARPAKFDDLLHTGEYAGIGWVKEFTKEVALDPEPTYFVIKTFAKLKHVPARNDAGPLFPGRDEDTIVEKVYAEVLSRSNKPDFPTLGTNKMPDNIIIEKLSEGLYSEETEKGLVTVENQFVYSTEDRYGIPIERRLFIHTYRISETKEILVRGQSFKKNVDGEYEVLSTYYTYNWKSVN
ncbi:MAG: hypothetical protein VX642_13210 [Bdellovibrionota bacterium]|nr:hypothetical protein [Bdellovibrionota bacterium]